MTGIFDASEIKDEGVYKYYNVWKVDNNEDKIAYLTFEFTLKKPPPPPPPPKIEEKTKEEVFVPPTISVPEVEEDIDEELVEEKVEEAKEEVEEEEQAEGDDISEEKIEELIEEDIEEIQDEKVPEKNNDGSITIAPFIPPWLKLASKKEIDALKPKIVKFQVDEEEEIPPLAIKNTEISRDGLMSLQFNQDITVPAFSDKKKRFLLEISSFDLRNVIGLKFNSNGEGSQKDSQFSLILTDWTAK